MHRFASVARPTLLVASNAALVQRRWQYQSKPEDREAETFLSTHNPFTILGIEETSDLQQIKDAHKRLIQYYAPHGPKPNKTKFELVQKAHDVLTTPTSPYFTKARPNDYERHKLSLQLLSKPQRNFVKLQAGVAMGVVAFFFFMTVYIMMLPTKKAIRAVTR